MSTENPDLVLHMGNYNNRQWMCPYSQVCADINDTAEWGDSILSWYAEFFRPFARLLDAAPWIMSRGNHEVSSALDPNIQVLETTVFSEACELRFQY